MSDQPDSSPPVPTDYLLDEIRDVRAEVRSVRSDLQSEIRELRAEARADSAALRSELRSEIRNGLNRITATMGVLFAALALLVTVVQFALR